VGSASVRDSQKAKKRTGKPRGADRLSQDEIDSLVRDSIKSRSPIERRLALDRILEKIEKSGMSFEDALAIEKALREQGAKDEWKLLGYALGARMPREAVAYLDKIPADARMEFLGNMIPGLASENPDMAIDLFESLETEVQAKIRPSFLEGLVDNDAVVATDYLYDSTDLDNYNWRPADELARELIRDEGLETTLNWLSELPEGALRRSAWSGAYAAWASENPTAAVESINKMSEGTDRNLAINGFASAHAHKDGEAATTWAAEITEPGLREDAMIRVGKQYYSQDPESASQWFASSGLSPAAWEQVINSVKR
jgi:hypothetical protein